MAVAEDQLLTVREVAERLKVTDVTVQRWLRAGRLQGIRMGGTRTGWRVQESELRRFIESAKRDGE